MLHRATLVCLIVLATLTIAPSTLAQTTCHGDEQLTFSPSNPVPGEIVTITATSAQPSVNVGLLGPQNPAYIGVHSGGAGTVWVWTVAAGDPGTYTFSFYVSGNPCTTASYAVQGATPCRGDEAMTITPAPADPGQPLRITVTSAQPSAFVEVRGPGDPHFQGVQDGGLGTIWTWQATAPGEGSHQYQFVVQGTVCTTANAEVRAQPTNGCQGDEEIWIHPAQIFVGDQVTINVTSAHPSANVGLSAPFDPTFTCVSGGGKGTIWTWQLTPNASGNYEITFTINGVACNSATLAVHER